MREAVIVSTARTPIGKAYRGAFNDTQAQALGGHVIKHAVERAKIDPETIQDVIMGAALQQGGATTAGDVGNAVLHDGFRDEVFVLGIGTGVSRITACRLGVHEGKIVVEGLYGEVRQVEIVLTEKRL